MISSTVYIESRVSAVAFYNYIQHWCSLLDKVKVRNISVTNIS